MTRISKADAMKNGYCRTCASCADGKQFCGYADLSQEPHERHLCLLTPEGMARRWTEYQTDGRGRLTDKLR